MSTIKARFGMIQENINKINNNNMLSNSPVTVLAASKGQPAETIREAIAAGITDFGENRVQEAEEKWPALKKEFPHIRLHLIGPLQTNKVKKALELFDVMQTVDRMKLAETIVLECKKARIREGENKTDFSVSRLPECSTSFYIQVNIGKEPQKAGVMPEGADALIGYCKAHLPVVGLMCIPPASLPPAPHFALLRSMAMKHGLHELSMGMSDDYETAIRMGSTCVRLGRCLFGERPPTP